MGCTLTGTLTFSDFISATTTLIYGHPGRAYGDGKRPHIPLGLLKTSSTYMYYM